MSLLTALLANPLDAGYEHNRHNHGAKADGIASRLAVFGVAIALGFGFVIAIASLRAPTNDVKDDLKEQAAAKSRTVEELSQEVQSLGQTIDELSHSGTPVASDPARDLATATRSVAGPGITVTLTDRNGPGKGSGAVRDQDVAMVVNALWAAGAEAISVNGQRIGPQTFVRTAGSAILVNVTPVSSPYEVSAIGDSNALSIALVRGATGDYLSAAQSVSGMTVSTRVAPHLAMEALAPSAFEHATFLESAHEGDTQ